MNFEPWQYNYRFQIEVYAVGTDSQQASRVVDIDSWTSCCNRGRAGHWF